MKFSQGVRYSQHHANWKVPFYNYRVSTNNSAMDGKLTAILDLHFKALCNERYFRATGLTSAKGQLLNGRICSVRGYDIRRCRLRCKFSGEKKIFMIKGENLKSTKWLQKLAEWQQQFPANLASSGIDKGTVAVTGENFLETLEVIVVSMMNDDFIVSAFWSRLDKMGRVLKTFVSGLQEHEEILCCDLNDAPDLWNGQRQILEITRRPCLGSGKVYVRDFINHMDPQRLGWLGTRFREYIISGFCVMCQIYYFEMRAFE